MKAKLYTILALLFVCAKSFAGITAQIISPSQNSTQPNIVYVETYVSSQYDIQSVRASVLGVKASLTYNSSRQHFTGIINTTGLPDGNLALKIIVKDILNNVDSSTSIIIKRSWQYKPVNGVLYSPKANDIFTGKLTMESTFYENAGYYKKAYEAEINGKRYPITSRYTSIDLTGFPQRQHILRLLTTDMCGNVDTVAVPIYYDKIPGIAITGDKFTRQPFVHIKATAISDSGHCIVQILNPLTAKVILQGLNSIDTVIDVTGFASPGNVNIPVQVKDQIGLQNSSGLNFIYETSPYLEDYTSDIPKQPNVPRVTTKEIPLQFETRCGQNFCENVPILVALMVTTPDTSFTVNPLNYNTYVTGFPYHETHALQAINDNYLIWANINHLYRVNLHTYAVDSFPGLYATTKLDLALDTNGNFAAVHSDGNGDLYYYYNSTFTKIATGASGPLVISGNKLLYNKAKQFYLHDDNRDTLFDNFYYKEFIGVLSIDGYYPVFKGNYIAYYKKGSIGQPVIWLSDSLLRKTRISITTNPAVILELNDNGNIVYNESTSTIYFADKLANKKEIAHFGTYYNFNGQRFILSPGPGIDNFKINLNISDSLLPIKREVKKDSAITFAKTDFDNAYKGPGYVFKVKITGLPKHGTLFINKVPITLDSVVNHASLGGLSYKPNPGYSGKDTIYWTAFNGAVFVANDTIIQLSVVSVLPVKLLSFTGTALGKANQLHWQTAQEVNSSYFGVEKSTDGIHFTSIGNVTAKGNSSITESYEYLDAAPQAGLNYYRLKIVDKDASFGYSQTISIRNTGSYITLAYPNPARSFVNLSFNAARAGRYSFTVYNASGKAVSTNRYAVNTGSQNITLPLSNMASGTYVIKVLDSDGNAVTEQKVVKQ